MKAAAAWARTQGKPSVVIAILDDGVDIDHPNLVANIIKNPDPTNGQDKCGRDFFVPAESADHYNPRPKIFHFPFNQMAGNDIHGTPCAGVAAAVGKGNKAALGVAPRCRILPVKIFHGDQFAVDSRVAQAIRYASLHADVISCSWTGPISDDIALAIQDAETLGRTGKGTVVVCAAGNELRQTGRVSRLRARRNRRRCVDGPVEEGGLLERRPRTFGGRAPRAVGSRPFTRPMSQRQVAALIPGQW